MQPSKARTTMDMHPSNTEPCKTQVTLTALFGIPLLVRPRWSKLLSPRSPFDVARTAAPTVSVFVTTDVEKVAAGLAGVRASLSRNTSANDGAYTVMVQPFPGLH